MPRRRTVQDAYFRRAKAEGYLARSAYKLIEIDDRKRLIRRGDRVLDLGCAPGSWLQVAAQRVGPKGRVVGIDLQETMHEFPETVHVSVADISGADPDELMARAGGPFDVVLSDMAPKTSGAGDHYGSVALCRLVLETAGQVLRRRGHLAMKVFEGAEYNALLNETRAMFEEVKGLKPAACRDVSSEIYIIAKSHRAEDKA